MDTESANLLPILLGLASTHDVRMKLTVKDNLFSGTITMKPRPQPRCRVGVGPSGPTHRVDGPENSSGGDSCSGSSAGGPTPHFDDDQAKEEARQAWRLLRDLGIDQHTAQKLAIMYPLDRVTEVTSAARSHRSPTGFAISALQGGWKLKKETT